jgi:NAD(P)-dependent dehydrogenase (short-subunit alcohol dehydrogenase family)
MMLGKVAIITGGAQGIGAACGREFLARQCDVLLADIQADALEATAQKMREDYPQRRIETYPLDVRQQSQCFAMADYAFDQWGKIDILVNSAGIISPCPSLEVTQVDWENLLGINLNGVFYCCQAVARFMQHSGGAIINLSSIASKAAWPGRVSYAAAKTGITGITESLAVEWASLGIRVNAVAPAWVNTAILQEGVDKGVVEIDKLNRAIPLGRVAKVTDVSKVIVFLAAEAEFITGQVIYVDGGYLVGAPAASIR